ncbi:hypothetical protein FLP10_04000 [Agromyces intestinalis]|uniref:O-antigen ligase domain-containing protein n=1 Tax=Agromyces intestinalis TaxID=2592652 RepID=A0A5C1YC51_9MICO|nr:hypothetical protein [Agromyces intestinalis]QEO13674.1 hypothetical protein FLP10_04000 [Agromyces intestinalis]
MLTIPTGLALPIKGLSVATLIQITATVCLLPAVRWLSRSDLLLLIALLCSLPASALPLLVMANRPPEWLQIIFFALCFVQLFLFIRASQHYDVRALTKQPTNLAAILATLVGGYQFLFDRSGYLTLYFDDKSHAAVALVCLAFLVLWVNDSFVSMPLAIILYFISMATASRLVLFAMPFFAIAVVIAYLRSRRNADTPLKVYGHHLLLVLAPILAVWLAATSLTKNLESRLSSTDQAAASSTDAHFELIRLAFEAKLTNPWFLTIGMGPGGFADALTTSGINLSGIAASDPSSYRNIYRGWQPVHSAFGSILTEFSLIVGIVAVVLIWKVVVALARRKDWTLLLLLTAMLLMTMFYSSHNEPFFTAVLGLVAGGALGIRSAAEASAPPNPHPASGQARWIPEGTPARRGYLA